jgi:hypothetical protein
LYSRKFFENFYNELLEIQTLPNNDIKSLKLRLSQMQRSIGDFLMKGGEIEEAGRCYQKAMGK